MQLCAAERIGAERHRGCVRGARGRRAAKSQPPAAADAGRKLGQGCGRVSSDTLACQVSGGLGAPGDDGLRCIRPLTRGKGRRQPSASGPGRVG
ncbi:hypothetical protein NDU88_008050 [Pleurodeles waltl]|uniref:Uncharacterized protein n=1 Tax=Pleurodeles waltl TaxID=8319 RepID=A0AAV7RSN9_PLEWA|nr:hypothetical protein NDU88_008050 [Pleurodeles waltl]